MKPETTFRQNKVIPFLKTLPMTVFFPIQQVSISGTPDFLLSVRGLFVALELKSENGVLSPLQKYNLEKVKDSGGEAIVCFPNNWEDVKMRLQKLAEEGESND